MIKKGTYSLMRKYFLLMLMAALISAPLFLSSDAAAKVYIDVDSPNFQLFPIAICDFDVTNANAAAKSNDLGITLADEVKRYLTMTGFFNPLNKKSEKLFLNKIVSNIVYRLIFQVYCNTSTWTCLFIKG